MTNTLSMGLLVAGGYNPAGLLVLVAGIGAALAVFMVKRNKDYAAEMARYEEALREQKARAATVKTAPIPAPKAESAVAQPVAPVAGGTVCVGDEVLLSGIDERTAAMVIAIVCDTIGGDPQSLRFASIRAL